MEQIEKTINQISLEHEKLTLENKKLKLELKMCKKLIYDFTVEKLKNTKNEKELDEQIFIHSNFTLQYSNNREEIFNLDQITHFSIINSNNITRFEICSGKGRIIRIYKPDSKKYKIWQLIFLKYALKEKNFKNN